jgi:Cof subfamily protein (haloacid dehalogenase superfamily)
MADHTTSGDNTTSTDNPTSSHNTASIDLSGIALVASDLDGTLLATGGTVSAVTRSALAAAEDAGLRIVFVTGRPPRWMGEIAEQSGHRGLAVCANGALLYDLHTEQIVQTHLITADLQHEVAAALIGEFGELAFALEHNDGFVHEVGYRHDWVVGVAPEVVARESFLDRPGIKMLVKHSSIGSDEFVARAQKVAGDRVVITSSSKSALLEISAPGVDKATGLAAVAERFGLTSAQVAAVGDMPNDLPMLGWAGLPCAVGNAHPSVLSAARRILPSNDDNGVAALITDVLAARSS